jgi:hypothetical protein
MIEAHGEIDVRDLADEWTKRNKGTRLAAQVFKKGLKDKGLVRDDLRNGPKSAMVSLTGKGKRQLALVREFYKVNT